MGGGGRSHGIVTNLVDVSCAPSTVLIRQRRTTDFLARVSDTRKTAVSAGTTPTCVVPIYLKNRLRPRRVLCGPRRGFVDLSRCVPNKYRRRRSRCRGPKRFQHLTRARGYSKVPVSKTPRDVNGSTIIAGDYCYKRDRDTRVAEKRT